MPAFVAVVVVLAVVNLTRDDAPNGVWQVVVMAALGLVVWRAGLTRDELGLGRGTARRGLRVGAIVFVGIAILVILGGALGLVTDERVAGSGAEAAWRIFVVIPLGTVAVEEFAFRGVLFGLGERLWESRTALVVNAVLFGMWHLYPAATGGAVTSPDTAGVEVAGPWLVAGTVLATTAAGFAFAGLRRTTKSVISPAFAHLALNSVGYAVAYCAGSRFGGMT